MNFDEKKSLISMLVDVSNVAFFTNTIKNGKKVGKLGNIEKMIKATSEIIKRNRDINLQCYYICDSTLIYYIDNPLKLEEYISRNTILQTPAGAKTDDFLYAYLKKNPDKTFIISNDLFRQFPKNLQKIINQWRVPFMIIDEFILDLKFESKLEKIKQQIKFEENYRKIVNTVQT